MVGYPSLYSSFILLIWLLDAAGLSIDNLNLVSGSFLPSTASAR